MHRLRDNQSYKRLLDLSEICDFSKSGKYRVQLFYDNQSIAEKHKGEWVGTFSGPVFDIEIFR